MSILRNYSYKEGLTQCWGDQALEENPYTYGIRIFGGTHCGLLFKEHLGTALRLEFASKIQNLMQPRAG